MAITIRDRLTGKPITLEEYNKQSNIIEDPNRNKVTVDNGNVTIKTANSDLFSRDRLEDSVTNSLNDVNSAISGITAAGNQNALDIAKTFGDNRKQSDAEELNKQSLEMLQKGATEGFDVDRMIANRALQESDLQGSANILAQSQRSASNPNLTDGAKQAQMSEVTRQQGIARSKLSGDLAVAAQERAFQALQKLTDASLQRAAFDEQQYQNDISNAFKEIDKDLQTQIAVGTMTQNQAANYINLLGQTINEQMAEADRTMQWNIANLNNSTDKERLELERQKYVSDMIGTQTARLKTWITDLKDQGKDAASNSVVKSLYENYAELLGMDVDWSDQDFVDSFNQFLESTPSTTEGNINRTKLDIAKSYGYDSWEAMPEKDREDFEIYLNDARRVAALDGVRKIVNPDGTTTFESADGTNVLTIKKEVDEQGNEVLDEDGKPIYTIIEEEKSDEEDNDGVTDFTVGEDGSIGFSFDGTTTINIPTVADTVIPFDSTSEDIQETLNDYSALFTGSSTIDGRNQSLNEAVTFVDSVLKSDTSDKSWAESIISNYPALNAIYKKETDANGKVTYTKRSEEELNQIKEHVKKQTEKYINETMLDVKDGFLPVSEIDFTKDDYITNQLYEKIKNDPKLSIGVSSAVAKNSRTQAAQGLYFGDKPAGVGQIIKGKDNELYKITDYQLAPSDAYNSGDSTTALQEAFYVFENMKTGKTSILMLAPSRGNGYSYGWPTGRDSDFSSNLPITVKDSTHRWLDVDALKEKRKNGKKSTANLEDLFNRIGI